MCAMEIEEKMEERVRVRIRAGGEEMRKGEKDDRGEVIDRW